MTSTRFRRKAWVFLLLVGCEGQRVDHPPAASAGPAPAVLQVTALANEGFLLRAGDDAVLIDAFLAEPYSVYDALPAEAVERMLAGSPPFDGVDLALVSHGHPDHLQADVAARYLAARPEVPLVSSPQVVSAIREAALARGVDADPAQDASPGGAAVPLAERLTEVLPEPGHSRFVEHGDIAIEVLRLSHGTGRFADVQNLGHVITVGGRRVLHIGDAAMAVPNLAPYALASRDLDVALVPYWYFLDGAGRELLDEHLVARHVIACHIPGEERPAVAAALAESHPDVIPYGDALQTWSFAAPDEGGGRGR